LSCKQVNPTNAITETSNRNLTSNIDLSNANLSGANLRDLNLEVTKLTNADLTNADITGTRFEHNQEIASEFYETQVAYQLQLYNEFYYTLISQSFEASSMFPFIRSKLIQFGLWPQYDETVILQEVFIRTLAKIYEGRIITNPSAWTRSVAYRYIRELSRVEVQHTVTSDEYLESLTASEEADREFLVDQMLHASSAFEQLSTEEQLILSLKVIENKPWAEIQHFLKEKGYGDYNLSALKQRKKRIVEKLRGLFHTLKQKQ
jgi:DNA-directed RNA polymerase specialized sigma24 family protein